MSADKHSKFNHPHRQPTLSLTEAIEFNVIEFLNFVYSHRRPSLILTAVFLVGLLFYVTAIQRPHYRASGTLNVNISSKSESFSLNRFNTWMEDQETANKVYTIEQIFESSQFHRAVIDEIDGKSKRCESHDCDEMREAVKSAWAERKLTEADDKMEFVFSRLNIHGDSIHYLLTVTATDQNPKVAQALASLSTQTLVDWNYQTLLAKNSKVRAFLESQTKSTSDALASLEKQLAAEQKKYNLMGTTEAETRLTAMYLEQQQRINSLNRDKNATDFLEKELVAEIANYKRDISSPDTVSFLYLSQIQKRFDLLKYQAALSDEKSRTPAAVTREMEDFGKVLEKKAGQWIATDIWDHIKKAENLLVEVRQQRDKIVSDISAAQQSIRQWKTDNMGLPDTLRRLTELKRNIQISTDVYSSLKTRLQEINIRDAAQVNDLGVLALPEIPGDPIGLSYGKKFVVSAIAAPMMSLAILLLWYLIIPLVRGPRDIENLGVKVLGGITQFRPSGNFLKGENYPQLFATAPDSYEANSIRYIRFRLESELRHLNDTGKGKVVTITSFNSREGKTFLSVNLSAAFAMSKVQVLIIDLDFKSSDLALYFGSPTNVSDLETEQHSFKFQLKEYTPYIHVLSLVNRDADVRDYIRSSEFRHLIDAVRDLYGFILFDTAPIDGNVEAYLVNSISDGAIFVVNHRRTLKEQVVRGLATLRESHQEKIFSVLNFTHDDVKWFKWRKRIA